MPRHSAIQSAIRRLTAVLLLFTQRAAAHRKFASERAPDRGFTLVETLVAMAIVAVGLTLAVGSLRELFLNVRLSTQVNEFMTDLNYARSEAVRRGLTAAMCKANSSSTDCDNSGTWHGGWLVFVDAFDDTGVPVQNGDGAVYDNGNSTPCEATEDCILRVRTALTNGITIRLTRDLVSYGSTGLSNAFNNSSIGFCDDRGARAARGLLISRNGRVRLPIANETFTCY